MEAEEQQKQEIEALQAIYPDHELEVISEEYPNIKVQFLLSSAAQGSSEEDDDFSLVLEVTLPEQYPDVIPSLALQDNDEQFTEDTLEEVLVKLRAVAEENVGMLMVFTLISALHDEMGTLVEKRKQSKVDAVEKEKQKVEELEQKRFVGTAVTPDSFKQWKESFDMERMILKEKQIKEREAALAGKMTGRQQFLRDATLNLSDAGIIQESSNVDIDESLFDADDLDALGLEDEDDEN